MFVILEKNNHMLEYLITLASLPTTITVMNCFLIYKQSYIKFISKTKILPVKKMFIGLSKNRIYRQWLIYVDVNMLWQEVCDVITVLQHYLYWCNSHDIVIFFQNLQTFFLMIHTKDKNKTSGKAVIRQILLSVYKCKLFKNS